MQTTAPAPSETYSSNGHSNGLAIRDFPTSERPRERLINNGPKSLSNAELMAILLRTGMKGENVLVMAQRLLATFGDLDGLARISIHDLCSARGVSEAKACQLLAAIELGRRVSMPRLEDRPIIGSAQDFFDLLSPIMAHLPREEFRVVLLDTKKHVIDIEELYSGSVDSSVVRSAEVFGSALRRNCPAIAIAHNHPSGDPAPSPEDILTTRNLVQAAKLLEIDLVDHIIIGRGRFVSMRERDLGFS